MNDLWTLSKLLMNQWKNSDVNLVSHCKTWWVCTDTMATLSTANFKIRIGSVHLWAQVYQAEIFTNFGSENITHFCQTILGPPENQRRPWMSLCTTTTAALSIWMWRRSWAPRTCRWPPSSRWPSSTPSSSCAAWWATSAPAWWSPTTSTCRRPPTCTCSTWPWRICSRCWQVRPLATSVATNENTPLLLSWPSTGYAWAQSSLTLTWATIITRWRTESIATTATHVKFGDDCAHA